MLLSSEAKQKVSSECWPRAQELSPVTSSATFYAVLSTWGVWGGGEEPAVKMQQTECNQVSPGLALSVSGLSAGGYSLEKHARTNTLNSPKSTNFSWTNHTIPGIQWSGIKGSIYRRVSEPPQVPPTAEPMPKPNGQWRCPPRILTSPLCNSGAAIFTGSVLFFGFGSPRGGPAPPIGGGRLRPGPRGEGSPNPSPSPTPAASAGLTPGGGGKPPRPKGKGGGGWSRGSPVGGGSNSGGGKAGASIWGGGGSKVGPLGAGREANKPPKVGPGVGAAASSSSSGSGSASSGSLSSLLA